LSALKTGQQKQETIEQKQERKYNRKRTDNRTETGQTIEQKQDRQ
jgi:hypothetical protein